MHYVAPAVPLYIALVVMSLRQLERLRIGPLRVGAAVAGAVVLVQLVAPGWIIVNMWHTTRPTGAARAELVERLRAMPGDHLVLVEYSDAPQQIFEWVYNEADIDRSRVVFARPMDEAGVRRLLDYYSHRRVWRLVVDGNTYTRSELPR
jgi:hypothetical protein